MVIDRKNQLASAGYDGRGNMTSWAGERYRWDEMDMRFQRDFPQDTYIYTADDERIFRLWWDGTAIHEIYRLRNLDNQVLRMYERELIPGGTAQWTWHTDYFHDPTGRMLLSVNNKPFPNRNQHYATDHLGSPLITTDQQGNIYATDSIWAYGEENEVTGPRSRRRFTGHERNADLSGRIFDLDYMHAREYSPHLGRFLSVDPARRSVNPVEPQSWNRYAYVSNNPMQFVDPDGRARLIAYNSDTTRASLNTAGKIRSAVRETLERVPGVGGALAFAADLLLSGILSENVEELNDAMLGMGTPVAGFRTVVRGAQGGLRRSASTASNLEVTTKKFRLNVNSSATRQVIENLDLKVSDFISKFRKGGINREFPRELLDKTVEEVLREGGTKARKLLIDGRFVKE